MSILSEREIIEENDQTRAREEHLNELRKLVGAKSYDVGSRWAGHGCGSPRLAQVYLCSFGFRQGYHLSPEILLHQ